MSKVNKIVKIGTNWCGPCGTIDVTLNQVEGVEVEIIDLDEHPKAAEKYQVKQIPLLIFEDSEGKELDRKVGAIPLQEIKEIINKEY